MNMRLLVCLTMAAFLSVQTLVAETVSAPIAEKIPTKLKKHGDTRIDDYFWLRKKETDKVLTHLKAENAYTEEVMKDTKDFQEKLYKEMRARIKEADMSVPYKEGNYLYYTKTLEGQQYAVDYRKKNVPNAPEELILDMNELGKGSDFINVPAIDFHPNEQLFAYPVDMKGDRVFTIYFKDMTTGKLLDKKIENVTENFCWAEAGDYLFYVKQDPQTLRSNRVYRYEYDSGISTLIYEEKDEKREVALEKTLTKKFIFINSMSTLSSEIRYIPADQPKAKFKVFIPRESKHLYSVHDGGDRFYILTNWKAENFKVMETSYADTTKKKWKETIPYRPDVLIDFVRVFKNHLVTFERSKGLTQLYVVKRGEKTGNYINFPDPTYSVNFEQNAEYDTDSVRYGFTSMNRPYSVYDFNFETQKSTLLKEKEVIGYKSSDYMSERVFATASDGAQIPISLVYRKGFKKDATQPLLVYGYGSYGASSDPYFTSPRVSLLDRGFVYAIIHVRGGSEMGRAWYENGKFLKKKNTFTDFIAGTEYLVKEKYGDPKKVFANGASAGGLLMGAIINIRPDLYNGVVAEVPFVDVVTTMLDSTLPLTTGEYEEWGNPNNKKYYDYMKSYSPYDNVKAVDYPNLLVTTGLNDSQVSYWEPTKWVSKIRDLRTDKSKLLLMKIEMEVGHGGKSGRFEYLRNEALVDAFYLKLLGVSK